MWTPPINKNAELTQGALKSILYSELGPHEGEGNKKSSRPLPLPLEGELPQKHRESAKKEFPVQRALFKGAQVWDFRPIFFYNNKSYMGRWLEDWRRKNFFSKTTADIRHFGFFTQAEPALKICLRRLSLR